MTMHPHEAVMHAHDHAHMVHYQRHGTAWEHMSASHGHEHNHPWSSDAEHDSA